MKPERRIDESLNIFKNTLHLEEVQPAIIIQLSLYIIQMHRLGFSLLSSSFVIMKDMSNFFKLFVVGTLVVECTC
jgi:hypothetical protein